MVERVMVADLWRKKRLMFAEKGHLGFSAVGRWQEEEQSNLGLGQREIYAAGLVKLRIREEFCYNSPTEQ